MAGLLTGIHSGIEAKSIMTEAGSCWNLNSMHLDDEHLGYIVEAMADPVRSLAHMPTPSSHRLALNC